MMRGSRYWVQFGCACAAATMMATAGVRADDVPYNKAWRVLGATGTPTSSTASLAYFNDTGTVSMKSSVTSGVLRLFYSVTAVDGVVWGGSPSFTDTLCLQVVARAENAQSRVRVTLYSRDYSPGTDPNAEPLGTADSDTIGYHPQGYGGFGNCNLHQEQSTAPLLSLDFGRRVYYVLAELIKTGSSGNPGLLSIGIAHEQP